jgi:predicted nucleic acid-binding protein
VQDVVLDTDVSSRSIKGQPVGRLAGELVKSRWHVTFVTVGELWRWASVRRWGRTSRAELERWLARVTVLESDDDVCRTWGQISADANRRGRPRPINDSWIAACCLSHDLPLATLNLKDFVDYTEHEGLTLLAN